jgi:TetR/AcrR family transcriptional regulator, transcriptional repressor for nem operon
MRYDTDQKERTHRQILAEAADAIRRKGPDRVGVAEVMNKLGLTHGGFYAHFASKDDLIAQAITSMFDQGYDNFLRRTESLEPPQALAAYVDWYLSPAHRDAPSGGCPLAAVSGDLPRLPQASRIRYTEGIERLATAMATLLNKLDAKNAEALAFSALAEMAGTLTIARAVLDPGRSDQLLKVSRGMVKARLGILRQRG